MRTARRPLNRAAALAVTLVLGGAGLTACSQGGDDNNPDGLESVLVATPPGFYNTLPMMLAQEEGILAENGIEAEMVDVTNGGTMINAIVSGSADVGMNMSPQLLGVANQGGQELRYFCGNSNRMYFDLLVKPESDLPRFDEGNSVKEIFEAMEGMRVGVITVGGVSDLVLQGAILEAGVDPSTMDFISVGAGPSAVTAFETDQIDVLHGYPFVTQELLGDGRAEMLVNLTDESEMIRESYSAGFIATKTWIEENPEPAQKVCDSYGQAIELMNDPANRDKVDALLAENFNLTGDSVLAAARDELARSVTTDLPREMIDHTYKVSAEVGAIPAEPELNYENTVLLPGTP